MELTIRYFASVREQNGVTSEVIHIDSAELAIDTLRATLASRNTRIGGCAAREPPDSHGRQSRDGRQRVCRALEQQNRVLPARHGRLTKSNGISVSPRKRLPACRS
ncbi:hypothetical protein [Paraburkholderia sp. LEh10]|jgi:hypothetical protein|uniref:hypothetical protein n=1 Tax=Paraburkholderia sp. LEh10 TaxID=2821353 RepID=UPI001FD86270|nr:hypothetical protein [Paraburkholderia sp. LEh10]